MNEIGKVVRFQVLTAAVMKIGAFSLKRRSIPERLQDTISLKALIFIGKVISLV
jgi:hypothetical protein